MSDVAIRVENLSKLYHIGQSQRRHDTLRDALTDGKLNVAKSISWLGRSLTRHSLHAISLVPSSINDSPSDDIIWALNDVSFEVNCGEVVGIIGRNGAGKSTLLKILSRITEPTKGRAIINGRVGSLLEVGTGFHPELTGRENIYLNGAILGMKRAEINRKFDEIVAFAEIEKFMDTPVKRYSSGMYVRLAFAVAAHLEPEILLVDEVLAVGDAAFQKKCLGKMGDVAKEGRTVLYVSHNMPAIEALCSRALVFSSGHSTFEGPSQDSIAYYFQMLDKVKGTLLRDRRDREGSGEARVIDIKILNENDEEVSYVGMGENFSVEIRLIGHSKKAVIGILIGDRYRQQLIRGYTWEQVAEDIELTGNNVVQCHFENFPMMHGVYNVHVWIGRDRNKCMDFVENATELTVVPKDVFGTGRKPDPKGGLAFCQAKWVIDGVSYGSR